MEEFVATIRDYYRQHARKLPWRVHEPDSSFDPYKILVSEIMLQQTQVSRVIPKYTAFLQRFPSLADLAQAPLGDVLQAWNGLGYNRRAKYLHQASGSLLGIEQPWTQYVLEQQPGIGPNTAAAICVYSYNEPLVFIETNVRFTFIHHFFSGQESVSDKDIIPLVERALEGQNPREFYWALMDYGTHIKASAGNASRRSRHYAKQSQFKGSNRELRGKILRLLAAGPLSYHELDKGLQDKRLNAVLGVLIQEGLAAADRGTYRLP